MSRLANRFDGVIKKYCDQHRKAGTLPSFLADYVTGTLENPFQERYYISHNNIFRFYGKLDECLVTPDGCYAPIDHKTSSSDPRKTLPHPAYQQQLNAYAWLLEANGKPTTGKGVLVFYYPDLTENIEDGFNFVIKVVELNTYPKQAEQRFLKGMAVLEDDMPEAGKECVFCEWSKIMKVYG